MTLLKVVCDVYLWVSGLWVPPGLLRGSIGAVGIAEDTPRGIAPSQVLPELPQLTFAVITRWKESLAWNFPAFPALYNDSICYNKAYFKEVNFNKQNRFYSFIFSTETKATKSQLWWKVGCVYKISLVWNTSNYLTMLRVLRQSFIFIFVTPTWSHSKQFLWNKIQRNMLKEQRGWEAEIIHNLWLNLVLKNKDG